MENNYKGYSLFNDVEEQELRNNNRAVVLANLAEDNTNKEKKISPKGAALILGYFSKVPAEERNDVQQKFTVNMISRGFKLG